MTAQIISLDQVREQRPQKSNLPQGVCPIKSFKDLYCFLVSTVREVGQKKAYNAGLVRCAEDSIDHIHSWDDYECRAHFDQMMLAIMSAGTECREYSRELIEFFYETWSFISINQEIPIEEACEDLAAKLNRIGRIQDGDQFSFDEPYLSYETKGDRTFLKGTKRLEEEFKVRVSLHDRRLLP
jgi:hypothetical protein